MGGGVVVVGRMRRKNEGREGEGEYIHARMCVRAFVRGYINVCEREKRERQKWKGGLIRRIPIHNF